MPLPDELLLVTWVFTDWFLVPLAHLLKKHWIESEGAMHR